MSSDKIPSSSIFNSLDAVNKNLESISARLEKLERSIQSRKETETGGGSSAINRLPAIMEKITSARDLEGVADRLLESLEPVLSRGMILSFQEDEYIIFHRRGFPGDLETETPSEENTNATLLNEAVNSRQMIIIKGDLSRIAPHVSSHPARTGYGVFFPLVFGEQVPLVLYGESDIAPDPDLIESVAGIAGLVIKNQHLTAMLSQDLSSTPETIPHSPGIPVPPADGTDIEGESEDEGLEISGFDERTEKLTAEETEAIRRSVDDFESDIISAEELIRSFNIDINGGGKNHFQEVEEAEEGYLESVIDSGDELPEEDEGDEIKVDLPAGETGIEIELTPTDGARDKDGEEEEPDEPYESGEDYSAGYEIEEIEELEVEIPSFEKDKAPDDFKSGEEESPIHDDGDLQPEVELPEEELEEARSFARLLVSEIKLYNEEDVEEGRKEGNLYNRLKEQIDVSREVYEGRVSEEIRSRNNYFDDELVRILARGDSDILGINGD